jgi:ssDNA-binding Zn-finger/Zn-ribbon topoisomerase 1
MTERQVELITNLLLASNIDSRETRKEHVKSVKSNIRKRNETINSGICPRCGGRLVKRQGKYGSFYGCSNYPKCKYTLK